MTSIRPTYKLRFFFDAGSGTCLWAANDVARERIGYAIENQRLSISENLQRYLNHLATWYNTSIDWNYPPNPSPWSKAESERFSQVVVDVLPRLREELGSKYEIADEHRKMSQD